MRMRNKLLSCVALSLSLLIAGCKTMEPRPEPPGDCTTPGGTAPTAPPAEWVPDTTPSVALPASSHIVVGFCPTTGTYEAMGVDTQARRYTFHVRGTRASQPAAFRSFYDARVPVTVYTQRVMLTARGTEPAPGSTTPAPGTSSAMAPAPTPSPTTPPAPTEGSAVFDPCADIGDPPPDPAPGPTGSRVDPTTSSAFPQLSWRTAFAVDSVTDPVTPSTAPVPR